MTSSFTPLGFNKQGTGDNANAWGDVLNLQVFDLVDEAIRGRAAFTLSGSKTLTATNGASNEARCAILHVTGGTGGTITVPDLSKLYVVINAASGDVVVSASGGTDATVKTGETVQVACDGTNVVRVAATDFGNSRLTNVGDPSDAQDVATKAYVDAASFAAAGGNLPGQSGNTGKYLTTDGSVASWSAVLPSQSGNSGKVLKTNGSAASWAALASSDVDFSLGITMDGSAKIAVHALSGTDIDVSVGQAWTKAISTNTTFTFSGATAGKFQFFAYELTITGAAVPTWPTSVDWGGSVAPTLGNGRHVLGFVTFNGGTDWTGMVGARAAG